MSRLAEQVRRERLNKCTVGSWTFIVRRPTTFEASKFFMPDHEPFDIVREFVEGWENVPESDVIASGSNEPADFSKELWSEWVSDHPETWQPIYERVSESYRLFNQSREDAGNVSAPG